MAIATIQDLAALKNDAFAKYFNETVIDRSRLFKSGICATDPAVAAACAQVGNGGDFVNLPYFNALGSGATATGMEQIVENQALTPENITASKDVAVITTRGKAFGVTDLAAIATGSDPLKAIADGLADWMNKQIETKLIATLGGAVGADLTLDISTATGDAAYIDHAAILNAAQLLGDNKAAITTLAMNSAVENHLARLDAQTTGYVPSTAQGEFARYIGKQVVTDDAIPYTYTAASGNTPASGVGTVYLFAPGAVAFNVCPIATPFETFRDELKSHGGIIVRQRDIVHLRGVKWNVQTANPTDVNLATAGNWSRVYPVKAIRCVKLVGKIAV